MPPSPFPRPSTRQLRAWGLVAIAASLLGTGGCRRQRRSQAQVPTLAVAYDLRPIDAEALQDDAAQLRRAVGMPAGEVAARLKSFRCTDDVRLQLVQVQDGNVLLEETLTAQVEWDAQGNVQASQRGSRHSFELVAFDEKAYVRLDRGHMRSKGRRDVEVEEMVELAYTALRQGSQQFGRWRLGAPKAGKAGGRAAVIYTVVADAKPAADAAETRGVASDATAPLFPPGALPTVVPGAFRQDEGPRKLEGELTVDQATGVVLAARLVGERTFDDATGRPVRLALQVKHAVTDAGGSFTVREPRNAVSEYRRPIRPHDPLSFFRRQLPQQKAGESAKGP